jgi:hypothetical protein
MLVTLHFRCSFVPSTHPPGQIFLCIFKLFVVVRFPVPEMYNFETASPEERLAERDRQRYLVANIPRATPTSVFLAASLQDHLFRTEDAVLCINDATAAPGNAPACVSAVKYLRAVISGLAAEVGSIILAGRFDIEAAVDTLGTDEDIPGVSTQQLRAAQMHHRQREVAACRVAEEQSHTVARCRQQANAAALALAPSRLYWPPRQ